jgi:peptidase C13-like protein
VNSIATTTRRHETGLGHAYVRAFVASWLVICSTAASALAQQTHVLVIVGVPGDEEHAQKFQKWASTFVDAAKNREHVAAANVTLLADRQATRAGVEKAFGDIAARAKPNDEVFVLLIGHGSFDGQTAAFNLPGPDLTAADYARLLEKFASQRVVFVNTASSSGAFLKPLAGPGRVIVTATRTGGERNDTDFPEYFVAAYTDDAADRDRNGHVSVAEAFEYAKTRVVQAFQQKGLLLTEHAALDDGGEGRLAATMFLGSPRADAALDVDTSDPKVKALVDERDLLQTQIAMLQAKRGSTDEAHYAAEMERLLTQLALNTKALRDLQAKK